MRTEEKWVKWEPVGNLTGEFYEEFICDRDDGFRIVLYKKNDGEKIRLQIKWKRFVASYTVTNETYLDKVFSDLRARDGTYAGGMLFKIINSEYLKRLSYSSGSLSDYMSFTHFVILSSDSVIDVVADYEPEIEFVEVCKRFSE